MEENIKHESLPNNTVARKRGRPVGTGNPSLKLTCVITGKKRATNQNYLKIKSSRLGVSVDDVLNNYVSKEGLKQLTEDTSYDVVKKEFLLKINGGTRVRIPISK
jgi:hypothetical protein